MDLMGFESLSLPAPKSFRNGYRFQGEFFGKATINFQGILVVFTGAKGGSFKPSEKYLVCLANYRWLDQNPDVG